jgi:hypothetical protein
MRYVKVMAEPLQRPGKRCLWRSATSLRRGSGMSRSLAGACEDSDRFRIEATVEQQAEPTMEPHTDAGHPKWRTVNA